MGTGRRRLVSRVFRRSVARYCVGHAKCPVVAVPPNGERYVIGPPRGRYVVQWRTFLGEKIEYALQCEGKALQAVRYNAGPGEAIAEGATVSVRFAEGAVTLLPEPEI